MLILLAKCCICTIVGKLNENATYYQYLCSYSASLLNKWRQNKMRHLKESIVNGKSLKSVYNWRYYIRLTFLWFMSHMQSLIPVFLLT